MRVTFKRRLCESITPLGLVETNASTVWLSRESQSQPSPENLQANLGGPIPHPRPTLSSRCILGNGSSANRIRAVRVQGNVLLHNDCTEAPLFPADPESMSPRLW